MGGGPVIRRAGAKWRVLVHEMLAGGKSGSSHHFGSIVEDKNETIECSDGTFYSRGTKLDGYDLDEVVVGRFLHLEQKNVGLYWLNVGGVTIWIRADRDGRPTAVDVYGPSDYDGPVEGCEYHLTWSDDSPPRKGSHSEPSVEDWEIR